MKSVTCSTVWFDGKFIPLAKANVPITTHAIHYGTTVFEGIRAYWNGSNLNVFRLEDHISRLVRSAEFYSMHVRHSESEMAKALVNLCSKNKLKKSCYIRPFCFVGDFGIQLEITARAPVHTAMYAFPANRYYDIKGITLGVSSWKKFSDMTVSHMAKAGGNYLNAIIASQEAHRNGYDDALMLDTRGIVSETPGANVFIVRDGKITTPTLASSPLEGLTRHCVFRMSEDMGMESKEADIARSEIYVADEMFVTGTAAEITPITFIDGKKVGNGKPGPVTKKLIDAYNDIVMGKNDLYSDWLTPVY